MNDRAVTNRNRGSRRSRRGHRQRRSSMVEEKESLSVEALTIRRAKRSDAPALIRLIQALAAFENLTPPNRAQQRRLIKDGFGIRPRFEAWLAFRKKVAGPVGYAIVLETYSTFCASPTLYLEDIFVLREHRRQGIGSALLRHCVQLAYDRGCDRMEWTCLDWNRKAQSVYRRIGARRLDAWQLFRLDRTRMTRFLRTRS